MKPTGVNVSMSMVAERRDLRIDPHFYSLYSSVSTIAEGVSHYVTVDSPHFRVKNGLNLPQAAYAEEESDLLYASVGALSLFALRPDRCTPLRSPEAFAYSVDLDSERVDAEDVLITRSGTPGIAWAHEAQPQTDDVIVVPSGFVISVRVPAGDFSPSYLAAVLNHPAWRVWSSALSAGKRQRNLSQEHLATVRIPKLSKMSQGVISEAYKETLSKIRDVLSHEVDMKGLCDEIIWTTTDLKYQRLRLDDTSLDVVALADIAKSSVLRMDGRFHRGELRSIAATLDDQNSLPLGELLESDVIKGSQPVLLQEDDVSASRVVATVSIQGGRVVDELTKPTTEDQIIQAGSRALRSSDLLIAMDGEGSIGKAAVFDGEYDAVTDSHLGTIRLSKSKLAPALACFLNSSLGQAQIMMATSGSTGQTQISKSDVMGLRVPVAVVSGASKVGKSYEKRTSDFDPPSAQARRLMAALSVTTGEHLVAGGSLSSKAKRELGKISDIDPLLDLLGSLKPEMF
jgi:hypothetical protein